MSKIKVAHITTVAMSVRHLLLHQLQAIKDAGYDVVAISAPGPDIESVRAAGIRHIPVAFTRRMTPMADLKAFCQLFSHLRSERFTIVHTHQPKPGLLGQLAARAAGVPIVVNTLHGFYFHELSHPVRRWAFVALEKMAALCSDSILSQNAEDIETAVREGICPRTAIKHLGNGIDVLRFDRNRMDSGSLLRTREELGIPEGARVVGFVGRLVEEKGLLELLRAADIVLRELPSTRFLIVGPTDADKSDALDPGSAEACGVADACVFTGLRHDMPNLYALMDVLVLPSHREGFPRAPMEASAMGVPCVVTDIRGCREAVEHGQNGLLVPLHDPESLAMAILQLLADSEMANRMGDEGRRMAMERFDERLVFRKVLEEYDLLLARKGMAGPGQRAAQGQYTI